MTDTAQQKGLILAGDLHFAIEQPDGSFGPFHLVAVDKLTINTPSDQKQQLSKGRTTYGASLNSFPVPKPAEFGLSFSEITKPVFAMQLSGVLVPISVTGGAFADVVVVAALGAWVEIGRENLADGLVVKNSAGTVTYVAGTDYQVNPRLGLLQALPGGAITEAQSLKLTGTEDAVTGERIVGAAKYKHVLKIKLDGMNLVDQRDVLLFADRCVLASEAAMDFLKSDLADVALKGQMEIPGPGLAPFTVEYRRKVV